MADSIANIVLVNILRAHLAASPRSAGWPGALSVPRIGSAPGMVHEEIARRWKVEELASKVGMSRTAFIERFKDLVGLPPVEYLIRWRMTIARDALKTGNDNLSSIAAAVGYASETTFVRLSKRCLVRAPAGIDRKHEARFECHGPVFRADSHRTAGWTWQASVFAINE